jgi:uncharacterized caspase-like protein
MSRPGWQMHGFAVVAILMASASNAANYALIVGVNDCPDYLLPNQSKFLPLRGAENDADAVHALLAKHFGFSPDNIKVLKGNGAKFANIQREFQSLSEKLSDNDRFVFHFSGHGTQIDDVPPVNDEADDGLDEALCPADVTADGKNLIVDDQLADWLGDIRAEKITVILDCCHSGTGIKDIGDSALERYLEISKTHPMRRTAEGALWTDLADINKGVGTRLIAMYASGSDQPAVERRFRDLKPAQQRGQFTHFLIDGLTDRRADANGDGQISVEEITKFVAARIDSTFNNKPAAGGRKQTPAFQSARPIWPLIEN